MRGLLFVLLLALAIVPPPVAGGSADGVHERAYDEHGRLVAEAGIVPGERGVAFVRHYYHEGSTVSDCTSTAYKLTRYRWAEPYDATTSAYAGEVAAALGAWDAETSRALVGRVTTGSAGAAGTFDGVNQLDWVSLGSGGTIAVTTTWYSRFTGIAVESDGRYNTYYPWSTTGSSSAMDVQNIVAHEVGHTFGLDHPKGKDVSCLTMYAYGSLGETQKRTLGTGDVLGIRAIYGS